MLKILVADDEILIRKGISDMIKEMQLPDIHMIEMAEDGEAALAKVKELLPELIIVDINMPFLDGLELIEAVRAIVPDSRIIIISGYDDFKYAQRALSMGVTSYLLKPVSRADLLQALRKESEMYTARMWERNQMKTVNAPVLTESDAVMQAIQYIDSHFGDNDLTLSSVAERFYVNKTSLSKKITQITGQSFPEYLNQLRMDRAKKMLEDPHYMIYEVASLVGYSSQHYFCRLFREYSGMSPTEYRVKHTNA